MPAAPDPCSAGCLRGHGDACHARVARVRRLCELIAAGRADYAQLVDRLTAGHPASGPPYGSADAFLAPLRAGPGGPPISADSRPWEGRQARKPWEYRITAAVVNLDTPDLLHAVLETLRAQAERPYLVVVDAGSLTAHRRELERMELASDDVEVHYLHPRAWRYTSQPVAVAMDLAFACCQSEYIYATHTDVFLKRPDYLAYLLARCDAMTPVVGYQMSPRSWATDLWKQIPSHTATLYHMPTMHRIRATWNMLGVASILGLVPDGCSNGWPDTEVGIGLSLQAAGIGVRRTGEPPPSPGGMPSALLIGPERNEPHDSVGWDGREDGWFRHERSFTGQTTYFPELLRGRRPVVEAAAAEAMVRVGVWKRRAGKVRGSLADAVAPAPGRR